MTKDEALKLALEALELHGQQYPHMVKGYCLDAITAIKEALAQPEQDEKFCDANCVWTDHHPDCKLAQPEQEPVAWMYQCSADSSGPVLMQHKRDWAESGSGLWTETPLYTTPPQRKPLTRERLVAMADVPRGVQTFDDWVELFGREIEAAHDITGDKK